MTVEGLAATATGLALTAVTSALAAMLLWRLMGSRMQRERWLRDNYRGEHIVATSGLIVVSVGIAGAVAIAYFARMATHAGYWFSYSPAHRTVGNEHWAALEELRPSDSAHVDAFRTPEAIVVTGAVATVLALLVFGFLGFLDDTRGGSDVGGFVAHIGHSWRRRRLTTGMHKALGGGVAALVCTQIVLYGSVDSLWSSHGWHDGFAVMRALGEVFVADRESWAPAPLVRGALIVALSANVMNLLDRAPGRSTKVALVWWLFGLVPVALADPRWPQGVQVVSANDIWPAWQSPALWGASAVGASVGLLGSELREQHMQGDTGVNATGAVLGLATVAMASSQVEWILLAILVILNLASERWSFSEVIDAVPPLRWLDRLGSPFRRR